MAVEITKRYLRIRVSSPGRFKKSTFRTDDIGRKGHSKRIAGIVRKTGKWETQSWLISRADIKKRDPLTLKLVNDISYDLTGIDRHKVMEAVHNIVTG